MQHVRFLVLYLIAMYDKWPHGMCLYCMLCAVVCCLFVCDILVKARKMCVRKNIIFDSVNFYKESESELRFLALATSFFSCYNQNFYQLVKKRENDGI